MLLATRPLPWAHKQAPAATQRWSETSARHPHRWSRSSASSGSGAGAPPAAAAAAPPSTNEQQPVASPRPNGTASGNGANGSATAATAKQQARMPRVPPLPYWCSSVAVVGLPDGAIAFSFLLTEGEAAEARRGLLRTERFGGGAVKLAVVSGDKAAALLDRWQAAATRGRLATLHARPPLWQTYDSAVKGMAHRARQQQRREHLEAAAAAAVQRRQQRRQEAADAASAAAARAPSPAAAAAGAPASAAEAEAAAREPATVPALESAGSEQLGSPPPSSGQQPEASIDAPWGSSGSGGAATGWQPLAAVLVACAAVAAVLRSAAAGAWALLLAAYRRLPVGFRRLFWGTWPPEWPGHASRNMATLLAHAGRGGKLAPQALEAAGFDSQGQTTAPLADLEAWQVERLTLTRVRDVGLYRAAFTHTSALPEGLRVALSYERLEWLGDAVLGLAVRHALMGREAANEGELTELASLLVSGASNARSAAFLRLHQYAVIDPRGMRLTPQILGDMLEALLGALYLDAGYAAAQALVRRLLAASADWARVAGRATADHKRQLAEAAAARGPAAQPRYESRGELRAYPDGQRLRWWKAEVWVEGRRLGGAGGWSRQAAEQDAARQALKALDRAAQ